MHAMWVHGHAAQSELAAKRLLQGDGVAYSGRPDEELWVHFAVPTPVIIADQRPALVRAFVLFRTEGGAAIVKVGIWDGARLAAEFDDLLLEGDHSQRLDEGNTFVIGSPFPVFWHRYLGAHTVRPPDIEQGRLHTVRIGWSGLRVTFDFLSARGERVGRGNPDSLPAVVDRLSAHPPAGSLGGRRRHQGPGDPRPAPSASGAAPQDRPPQVHRRRPSPAGCHQPGAPPTAVGIISRRAPDDALVTRGWLATGPAGATGCGPSAGRGPGAPSSTSPSRGRRSPVGPRRCGARCRPRGSWPGWRGRRAVPSGR